MIFASLANRTVAAWRNLVKRTFAACKTFWDYQPPERLPDIYSPQAQCLQQFRAELGGEIRIVRALRTAYPGHLVVQTQDGLNAGIVGEEKVAFEDRDKFRAALNHLPGHW